MKRVLITLAGVLSGFFAGFLASWVFGLWYSPRYIRGEEGVDFFFGLMLFGFLPVFMAVGGFITFRMSRLR